MVKSAAAGKRRKKKHKHNHLSGITRVVKVIAGAALVVVILFGAGILADSLFFDKDARINTPAGLLPFSGITRKDHDPRSSPTAESTAPSELSFFTTLLQKEDQAAKTDSLRAQVPQPSYQLPRRSDMLPPEITPEAQQPQGSYKIQLGSFKNKQGAESFSAELQKKGYRSYIIKVAESDQGAVYRVRIGNFTTLADAQHAAAEIEDKEQLTTFITSR